MEEGVVWQGSHLGEELLRLELGVSERPRTRAAAPGQWRALALALGSVSHRRGPLECPQATGGAPLPQHERCRRGQRLLVKGHGGLGGVSPATAAGRGGGAPLRLQRRGPVPRRAGVGEAGHQRAHRAEPGRFGAGKILRLAAPVLLPRFRGA